MTIWTVHFTVHDAPVSAESLELELPDFLSDDEVVDALMDEVTRVYGANVEINRISNDEV